MRSIFILTLLVSLSAAAVLDYSNEVFRQARRQRRARKEALAPKSKRSPTPSNCIAGPAAVGTSQLVITSNTECPTNSVGGPVGTAVINGNQQLYLNCAYTNADSSGRSSCVYRPDGKLNPAISQASFCTGTSGVTNNSERITSTVCPDVAGVTLVVANSAASRYIDNGTPGYELYCSYSDNSVCIYVGTNADPSGTAPAFFSGSTSCPCSAPVDSDSSQDLSYVLEY